MADQSVGIQRSKKSSRLNAKKQEKSEMAINPSWELINIDLVVLYETKMNDTPKVLKNLKIYITKEEDIVGSYLCQLLRTEGILREESSISFYDPRRQVYIFGFNTIHSLTLQPMVKPTYLKKQADGNPTLEIKIRIKKKLMVDALIEEQREKYDQNEDEPTSKQKEKKIGEVVEKVALWRKLYTGFYDEEGNYIQKPLETAAQEVGIAKKTLDDYLLQIRNGKKYGFNFNEKVNGKIGDLRAFVRDEKKKESK